jgi:hypothetical protein
MPCGVQLIEAVESHLQLTPGGLTVEALQNVVWETYRRVTMRAIRYAITELIRSGRARRDGRNGPVYAVRSEG